MNLGAVRLKIQFSTAGVDVIVPGTDDADGARVARRMSTGRARVTQQE
jgi:hypothetical protein